MFRLPPAAEDVAMLNHVTLIGRVTDRGPAAHLWRERIA